ncbi:HECT-domain-containing protein [Pseudocohnilembus persalinus]|uniref:HECT-domain-containing protein n=1 Tax=Pseudocohnilembus persalinus TaxID=266149 RepID=A0A0V0Q8H2_PSEPJ|nr:HECT-domain-containing protein [Pseudocohnilembus persalinus]|eukprot:KRW98494.1 HECT-domain-containing protein [Pseudocohnilembus persalinus]
MPNYYQFIGKMIGIMFLEGKHLDFKFHTLFYKLLVSQNDCQLKYINQNQGNHNFFTWINEVTYSLEDLKDINNSAYDQIMFLINSFDISEQNSQNLLQQDQVYFEVFDSLLQQNIPLQLSQEELSQLQQCEKKQNYEQNQSLKYDNQNKALNHAIDFYVLEPGNSKKSSHIKNQFIEEINKVEVLQDSDNRNEKRLQIFNKIKKELSNQKENGIPINNFEQDEGDSDEILDLSSQENFGKNPYQSQIQNENYLQNVSTIKRQDSQQIEIEQVPKNLNQVFQNQKVIQQEIHENKSIHRKKKGSKFNLKSKISQNGYQDNGIKNKNSEENNFYKSNDLDNMNDMVVITEQNQDKLNNINQELQNENSKQNTYYNNSYQIQGNQQQKQLQQISQVKSQSNSIIQSKKKAINQMNYSNKNNKLNQFSNKNNGKILVNKQNLDLYIQKVVEFYLQIDKLKMVVEGFHQVVPYKLLLEVGQFYEYQPIQELLNGYDIKQQWNYQNNTLLNNNQNDIKQELNQNNNLYFNDLIIQVCFFNSEAQGNEWKNSQKFLYDFWQIVDQSLDEDQQYFDMVQIRIK